MIRAIRFIIVIWAITLTSMAGASASLKIDEKTNDSTLPHMWFEESTDNNTFENFLMNLDGFEEC